VQSNFNPTNIGTGGLGTSFKINIIKYHPRVPNLIFIGTNRGIYRSTDNLATWTRLYNVSDINEIAFHPTNDSIIYLHDSDPNVGFTNKAIRSLDQGATYSLSNAVPGNNNSTSVYFDVSSQCSDCLYWASTNGVWVSTDKGMNFTLRGASSESSGGFAVNDQDTSKMIFGYVDVDRSTDGGRTWSDATKWSLGSTNGNQTNYQTSFNTSTNYVHADLHSAKCVNGIYYVGTDGWFAKSSDNGQNWTILGQGVATRENYRLGVSQSNHYRSISGSQDNGTRIKHQNDWIEFYGADGMEGIIHPLNDDWMIGSLQFGSRRRTTDGGQTQSGANPSGASSGAWNAPIAYDPNNQMTIYDFRDSIYKSTDFGLTYTAVGTPSFSYAIRNAAIAENNSNIIVVAKHSNIEKSIDGGVTFTDITNNYSGASIRDIAFDPKDDNVFVVVNPSYLPNTQKVFITTNGGTTWTNITHNLINIPVYSVAIDHTDASNIYIGTELGVFTKPMNSNTWSLYNTNLPNVAIHELEIVYGSNTLKAATWGRGMWEYTLVGRNNYPSIVKTSITDQPTAVLPKESVDQFVTSKISYANTLTSVYVEWSDSLPTFGNVIPMTNTVDSTWVSNTAIPNFPEGTKMYFKVFAVGINNDTTETYKFMYTVKNYEYCDATGNGTGIININRVKISNINNGTGQDYYTYYADSVVYLVRDSSYTITIEGNRTWSSIDYGAWIDFNHNSIFENTDALGFHSGGNVANFNFTVPANAYITDTIRLRTRISYYSTQAQPCGAELGEVEDYPVIIIQAPNLNYSFVDSTICHGSNLTYTYVGDPVDSVTWTYSNGTNTYNSSSFNGVINAPENGVYNVLIEAYKNGFYFQENFSNAFEVLGLDTIIINTTTCDPNDTGTVVQNLTNQEGCDSTVTIIKTFIPSTNDTINTTSCELAEVGTTIDTLVNAGGCDSILTTITTYTPNNPTIVNATTCDQANAGTSYDTIFVAGTCDSLITTITTYVPATYDTINTTSCELAEVGTTIDTLVNAGGCDSILTTVTTYAPNNPTIVNTTTCDQANAGTSYDTIFVAGMCDSLITTITTFTPLTASITISGNVLTAFPNGMTYQWINCETDFSDIVGETDQTYTATTNGSYAVIVSNGTCTDTSDCKAIVGIGIIENDFEKEIKLYPNPTSGMLSIEIDGEFNQIDIRVTNELGQQVIMKQVQNTNLIVNPITIGLEKFSTGVYFIHISSNDNKAVLKVLKN